MGLELPKYTLGVGDRFGKSAEAQLSALVAAKEAGIDVCPVWNKSFREHSIIGTSPADTRATADAAVRATGWDGAYFVDADHINLDTVESFIDACDFFTLDVAGSIGVPCSEAAIGEFLAKHGDICGTVLLPGIEAPLVLDEQQVRAAAAKYLSAVQDAGRIYRKIRDAMGASPFVTEVSMDETQDPQTPGELLVILAAIADAGIPVQTIAPRFSGRFNKGVDYAGDVSSFEREFRSDIAVIKYAIAAYGLPSGLKLSVHSGSDKFALYPVMGNAIRETGAGLHLKTAGTSWLEELTGLAEGGGEGLVIAQDVYRIALRRFGELCGPYADVIDIDSTKLPAADEVMHWNGAAFAAALRHDQECSDYNPHLRQLLHVGYKVAAEMGPRYLQALEVRRESVSRHVRENLLERHIMPLFART